MQSHSALGEKICRGLGPLEEIALLVVCNNVVIRAPL